jgi:hypothetical protein
MKELIINNLTETVQNSFSYILKQKLSGFLIKQNLTFLIT